MVDAWLLSHSVPSGGNSALTPSGVSTDPADVSLPLGGNKNSSGAATPVRKISAHEFERGGLLRPLVTNIEGTLTFISPTCNEDTHALSNHSVKAYRRNRSDLKLLDEKELIFELVKDICNDLDVRSLCHKILQVLVTTITSLLRTLKNVVKPRFSDHFDLYGQVSDGIWLIHETTSLKRT